MHVFTSSQLLGVSLAFNLFILLHYPFSVTPDLFCPHLTPSTTPSKPFTNLPLLAKHHSPSASIMSPPLPISELKDTLRKGNADSRQTAAEGALEELADVERQVKLHGLGRGELRFNLVQCLHHTRQQSFHEEHFETALALVRGQGWQQLHR